MSNIVIYNEPNLKNFNVYKKYSMFYSSNIRYTVNINKSTDELCEKEGRKVK